MTRQSPSTFAPVALSAGILLASASGLAALWPVALQAAHNKSQELTAEAKQAKGGEIEVNYRLATWLDNQNQAAYAGLAQAQINLGQPDAALLSLEHAGQGSEAEQLKVRTLIELGRYNQAANESASLITPGRSTNDIVLAGFSLALAGRATDIEPLIALVGSPEAATRLRRAQSGNLPLASELHATGLLNSSSALLTKLPVSLQRNLLLAQIRFARHSSKDLGEARELLLIAVNIDPANTAARKLLAQVYLDLNQTAEAQAQTTIVNRIEAGQI